MDTEQTHNREETNEEKAAEAGRKARAYRSLAKEPYQGPHEISAMLGRGTLLGGIAYVAGNYLGDLGDRPKSMLDRFGKPKYVGLAARFWELAFVAGAAIVGMYTASKEVRQAKLQHLKMQHAYTTLAHEHMATQQALESVIQATDKARDREEVTDQRKAAPGTEAAVPDTPHSQIAAYDAQLQQEPVKHTELTLS